MTNRQRRLVLVLLVAMIPGCGESIPDPQEPVALRVEEVARYGWESSRVGGEPSVLPDAGVLGRVVATVHAPDGNLYVLERDWRKIVVFSPGGDVLRVISVPEGEGPGEVRLPIDMVLTPDGNLAILDYQLSRVVELDLEGTVLQTIPLERPGPMRLVVTGEQIWTTRTVTPGQDSPSVRVFDLEGRLVAERSAPDSEERAFGPGLSLTTAPDGTVLQSQARPGLWRRFSGMDSSVQGSDLLPDLEPPSVVQESERMIRVDGARAFTVGIGTLPDGSVVQGHVEMPLAATMREPFDPSEITVTLSVFGQDGRLLGQAALPTPATYSWHVSPLNGHIFIFVGEPYPTVVEYRIDGIGDRP